MKICILGAESSGKTTMAELISNRFGAFLIPEFAREYCAKLNQKVELDDVLHIAYHQIFEYKNSENNSKEMVVFDTGLLTSIVWLEDKFSYEEGSLLVTWIYQKFDLIFLCHPDLPWEYDALREDEHRRHIIHDKYVDLLARTEKGYLSVTGEGKSRYEVAISAIANLAAQNK